MLPRSFLGHRGIEGALSESIRNHAIESLERAYQKREGALARVNVEPSFQPLRTDARFQQIAAQVGHRN